MIFGMKGTPYIYQGDEIGMTNVIYTESSRYQDIESVNFRKEKQELGLERGENPELSSAKQPGQCQNTDAVEYTGSRRIYYRNPMDGSQ